MMSKSMLSKVTQEKIADEKVLIGTVSSVRAALMLILQDTRFRKIKAKYSSDRDGKKRGEEYSVLAVGGVVGKDIIPHEKIIKKNVNHDLLTVYAADTNRRQHRSIKIPLIKSIEVYTGRQVVDKSKVKGYVAEKVEIPVVIIG